MKRILIIGLIGLLACTMQDNLLPGGSENQLAPYTPDTPRFTLEGEAIQWIQRETSPVKDSGFVEPFMDEMLTNTARDHPNPDKPEEPRIYTVEFAYRQGILVPYILVIQLTYDETGKVKNMKSKIAGITLGVVKWNQDSYNAQTSGQGVIAFQILGTKSYSVSVDGHGLVYDVAVEILGAYSLTNGTYSIWMPGVTDAPTLPSDTHFPDPPKVSGTVSPNLSDPNPIIEPNPDPTPTPTGGSTGGDEKDKEPKKDPPPVKKPDPIKQPDGPL